MLYDFTLYPIESILESMLIIFIGLTGSTFWSIVMLALSVRLLTKPLEKITGAAVKSQAQFEAVLRPQLAAIKYEYSGSQRHDAITRLYQRYSYHPIFAVRSLFGLLVQLPFFIAAYFMLSGFTDMSGVVIPLLGDLGVPDTLLFGRFHLLPFIMMFVNILALVTVADPHRKGLIQGLVISFVFLVLLYESPLGLIIYWTTSNLVSLGSNLLPELAKKVPIKISLHSFKGSVIERVFEEYAYIFFVVNLAVLVPLLGVLGSQYNLFTAHGVTSGAIISILFYVVLLPSIVLSLLRTLAKLLGGARAFDGLVLVVFIGIFLTYLFNKAGYGLLASEYEPAILLLAALLVTAGAVVTIFNTRMLRKLSYFSLTIPLVILHFVFVSPASTLFAGSQGERAELLGGINDTPVVLMVFDEFSGLTIQDAEGGVDASRYPGFAEIARNANYFPNALTVDYRTDISVPSMVSGTLRSGDNRGLAAGENLIELFRDWGGGVLAQSSVLPADLMYEQQVNLYSFASDTLTLYLHIISHQDWIENKIGAIPPAWKNFGIFYDVADEGDAAHSEPLEIFDGWLEQLSNNTADKQLNFLHVEFPHAPYTSSATGRAQINGEAFRRQLFTSETIDAEQPFLNVAHHNYLQQSSYADFLLKKLIGELKEADLYDKSLIIVTADHGVSYNVRGLNRRIPLNKDSWRNIVPVPLIIKYPFQEAGTVIDSFVTTLDIAPTIMDVTGVVSPWDLTGESLKLLGAVSQTSSVELTPGFEDYLDDAPSLFEESRSIKASLFGVGSPVPKIAVNYTENPIYSTLLNTDISVSSVNEFSDLRAVWGGSLRPNELTQYGKVYLGVEPTDGKVIAAVVNNKIQAIFMSGVVKGESGKFAFSLPEVEINKAQFAASLYEIETGESLILKRIGIFKAGQLTFETKKIIEYDWENSVLSSNGLDNFVATNKLISVHSSSSDDPFIVMGSMSDAVISTPTVRIELVSNKELLLQLFYQTSDAPFFAGSRSEISTIYEGNNTVYFEIPETEVAGDFRIDFGFGGFTNVEIVDIEVRY
ncbi:MAG: hypothetical protein ACI87Q_001429 [Pseudohongiellaceae bacterium]|jgi:hypothetical protein